MKEMTKEEMMKKIEELENKLENSDTTVKMKVLALIESGFNTIEAIATELKTNSKNISSNLTYLRNQLKAKDQTIISHRIGDKTYLKIMTFKELGWTVK